VLTRRSLADLAGSGWSQTVSISRDSDQPRNHRRDIPPGRSCADVITSPWAHLQGPVEIWIRAISGVLSAQVLHWNTMLDGLGVVLAAAAHRGFAGLAPQPSYFEWGEIAHGATFRRKGIRRSRFRIPGRIGPGGLIRCS